MQCPKNWGLETDCLISSSGPPLNPPRIRSASSQVTDAGRGKAITKVDTARACTSRVFQHHVTRTPSEGGGTVLRKPGRPRHWRGSQMGRDRQNWECRGGQRHSDTALTSPASDGRSGGQCLRSPPDTVLVVLPLALTWRMTGSTHLGTCYACERPWICHLRGTRLRTIQKVSALSGRLNVVLGFYFT